MLEPRLFQVGFHSCGTTFFGVFQSLISIELRRSSFRSRPRCSWRYFMSFVFFGLGFWAIDSKPSGRGAVAGASVGAFITKWPRRWSGAVANGVASQLLRRSNWWGNKKERTRQTRAEQLCCVLDGGGESWIHFISDSASSENPMILDRTRLRVVSKPYQNEISPFFFKKKCFERDPDSDWSSANPVILDKTRLNSLNGDINCRILKSSICKFFPSRVVFLSSAR